MRVEERLGRGSVSGPLSGWPLLVLLAAVALAYAPTATIQEIRDSVEHGAAKSRTSGRWPKRSRRVAGPEPASALREAVRPAVERDAEAPARPSPALTAHPTALLTRRAACLTVKRIPERDGGNGKPGRHWARSSDPPSAPESRWIVYTKRGRFFNRIRPARVAESGLFLPSKSHHQLATDRDGAARRGEAEVDRAPDQGAGSMLIRRTPANGRSLPSWTTITSYEPAAGCARRFRFEPAKQEPTSGEIVIARGGQVADNATAL